MKIFVSYTIDVVVQTGGERSLKIVNLPLKEALKMMKKGTIISTSEICLNDDDRLIVILDSKRALLITPAFPTPFPSACASAFPPADAFLPVYRGVNILYNSHIQLKSYLTNPIIKTNAV